MPESYLTGMDLFYGTAGPDQFRSVVYEAAPTVQFLIGMNATNQDAKDIGLAKSTVIIGPKNVTAVQRREVTAEGQYRLLMHARGKDVSDGDEKSMIEYDSTPDVSAPEDKAVVKRFDGPVARMVERERGLWVWHRDRDRTLLRSGGDKQRANEAIRGVYSVETKDGMAVMLKGFAMMLFGIHPDFPSGAPSDTTLPEWDCIYSFANAIDDANTYLGANRSTSTYAYFRGYKQTAARPARLEDILWEALGSGMLDTGGYTNLVVCGQTIFKKFYKEAKEAGYRMISVNKIPEMAQYGTNLQCIEFGFGSRLVYVLQDPFCPEYDANNTRLTKDNRRTLTFSYGHVYCLNTQSWTWISRGGKNFAKTPWEDLSKRPKSPLADYARMINHGNIVCELPSWQACFTKVQ